MKKAELATFRKQPREVNFRVPFALVLNYKRMLPIKKFFDTKFWPRMFTVHSLPYPISSMQDRDKNTPLHLAALWENEECTVKLLTDYQCSIDVRNHNGIMAKDIGCWHDKIGRVFKDFYAEFDKEMHKENGGYVGPDEDEKYSVRIAESFEKNAGNEADLFRRVVSSTGNNEKEKEEVREILKARS